MPIKKYTDRETHEQRQRRLEYNRNYNKLNPEKISKMNAEHLTNPEWNTKYTCGCGSLTTKNHKYSHNKTFKHTKWLKTQPVSN